MFWRSIALRLLGLPVAVGLGLIAAAPAIAQSEVKIALIAPLSGPWARQGDLMLKGAELALDRINADGGIEALGGAKMKLITFDAGDSVEKAKNAAQRMSRRSPTWSAPPAPGCRASRLALPR